MKKMSERLSRNMPLLKLLLKARRGQRLSILHTASDEFILALCEIALNILRGSIPLTAKQFTKLRKQKTLIKLIANRATSLPKKRRMLKQKGGFIVPLLSVALPFITSLFTARRG